LNKGKYGTLTKHYFLKNQSEMWRIHTVEEVDQKPRYNFISTVMDWDGDYQMKKGNFKVSHTGGLPGMLSIVTMYPIST
jgi:hypothetical protein